MNYGILNNVIYAGGYFSSSTKKSNVLPEMTGDYVDTTVKYSKSKTVSERFDFSPGDKDWSLICTPIRLPVTFSVDYSSSYKNLITITSDKVTVNRIPSENIVVEIDLSGINISAVGSTFELVHRRGYGFFLRIWNEGEFITEYNLSKVDMQLDYIGYKIENVNSSFIFSSEKFKKNYSSLNYDYNTTMVLPKFE